MKRKTWFRKQRSRRLALFRLHRRAPNPSTRKPPRQIWRIGRSFLARLPAETSDYLGHPGSWPCGHRTRPPLVCCMESRWSPPIPANWRVLMLHVPRVGPTPELVLIVGYAPQSSAPAAQRQDFLNQISQVRTQVPRSDLTVIGGDFNAEVDSTLNQTHQTHPVVVGSWASNRTSHRSLASRLV